MSPLPQGLSINGQSTLPPAPPRSEHPFNPDSLLSVHVTYPPPPSMFQPPLPQTTPPTIPPESSEEDEATSDDFASQESDSETVQTQMPAKPNQAPSPQPKEQYSSSGEEDSRSETDSEPDEPTSKPLASKPVAGKQKANGGASNARSKPNAPDPVTPTIPPQPTKAAPPEALPLPTTPTSPLRLQTAPSVAELKFSPPFLSAGQRVWLCGEPPPLEANLCEMANSEESNPLLPNQEGGKEELGMKDEKKSAALVGKSTGAPAPAAIPMGWTADGLSVAASMMERFQWNSGFFSVLGRNDDFCSSDLEVCLVGSLAPCVLYGSNGERLGSAPGTFANHCLPYTGLYFLGITFLGWNCPAPWFSYPIRTAISRKFNLEGSYEAAARSCGCCGSCSFFGWKSNCADIWSF